MPRAETSLAKSPTDQMGTLGGSPTPPRRTPRGKAPLRPRDHRRRLRAGGTRSRTGGSSARSARATAGSATGRRASASSARTKAAQLVSLGYGRTTGFAVDPDREEAAQPLLPGTPILSFGTAGCNLGCKFCQNWDISKAQARRRGARRRVTPDAGDRSRRSRRAAPSVAVHLQRPGDLGRVRHRHRARGAPARRASTVLVTAGYVTAEARPELFADIDAANVDLKAFTEDFYHKVTFVAPRAGARDAQVAQARDQGLVRDHQPA